MSADAIDNACDLEEMQRAQALSNHKNKTTHQPLVVDGVRCCIDCGDSINNRIKMLPNAVRCVICQEQFENQYGLEF